MKILPALAMLLLLLSCSSTTTVVGDEPDFRFLDLGGENGKDTVIIGPASDIEVADFGSLPDADASDVSEEIADGGLPEGGELPEIPDVVDVAPDLPDVVPDEVEEEEVKPEVIEEVKPEVVCTPVCGGKDCGSDGCEGVCGYCAYGELCTAEGVCQIDICPKQCTTEVDGDEINKECGADGCGGYCGFCLEAGEICGDDGFCYPGSCTPVCDGFQCGADSCGGACGFCQYGELCNDSQTCVPHPCGTVSYKGQCEDKYLLVQCVDQAIAETMCKELPDKMCGWDEAVGKYDCVPETECLPECLYEDGNPKECGPDGCWGSCGVCPKGWGCAGGKCEPAAGGECAWIDAMVGLCVGPVNWFCSEGVLYGYDCMAKEQKDCGWNANANFGLGGYDCL